MDDEQFMRRALQLAARGYGGTSPNPMVGAVLVRNGTIIGEGFHRRAGEPHAEINALRKKQAKGATLYVTLEPCCTHGRTPPCTDAIIQAGIKRVVVATRDPNPKHSGRGVRLLKRRGIEITEGVLSAEAKKLNEVFNFWVVHRRPFVHLKCAMSLDGKIATNTGESRWITGPRARAYGMRLRLGADAIIAGVNTIVRDDPALTLRGRFPRWKRLRRVVLDPTARMPLTAKVADEETTVVVGPEAPARRVKAMEKVVRVLQVPLTGTQLDLASLLRLLEAEGITSVLVEGGGETHFNFLAQGLVNRVHFFYAPLVITGRVAAKAVAGDFTLNGNAGLGLREAEWTMVGKDLLLTAYVHGNC